MNTNNTISFYSLVIGYLADKKDANALEYLEELKNNYKSVSNPKQEFLINDCDMTCKIYINQDIHKSHIDHYYYYELQNFFN